MPMPRKQPTPPADGRKARRSDPPYMMWRDGRPAWIPGAELRRAGWTLIALKDAHGHYLPRGLARIMARDINADVDRWRQDPAATGLTYGPAREAKLIISAGASDKTIANAFELMMAHRTIRQLSPKTRDGYELNLARFAKWAGKAHPLDVDRTALNAWYEAEWDRIFATRQLGWTEEAWLNAPRLRAHDGASYVADVRSLRWEELDAARIERRNVTGQSMMTGYIRAISRLYSFMADELKWISPADNPAAKFNLRTIRPRLRMPSDAELAHLVDTADEMGLPSIGDALVIQGNLCPRPSDMIGWTMEVFHQGFVRGTIRKTGAQVEVKLPAALRRRLSAVRLRREGETPAEAETPASDALILLTDKKRVAYQVSHLIHVYGDVRAEAAKTMPSLADITIYDFRAMGITRLSNAGNSRDAIAAVTGHSYQTVSSILDHYIVPTREAADAAVDKLDKHMKERGAKW